MKSANKNSHPPIEHRRAFLRAKLLADGFEGGPSGDPSFDASAYAADAETAAEGRCGHCDRKGLLAEPYFRETPHGLEYEALMVCPSCGWAFAM